MKSALLIRYLALAVVAHGPLTASAITYTLHADVSMSNIQWNVGGSSSLSWLGDWELQASASSYDNAHGFATDYQSGSGQPSTASAGANRGSSSASAHASVDAAGNPIGLDAALDLSYPPGVSFASAFSTASAYREFEITGGDGKIEVTFSYDYLAHLAGDAPGHLVDYRALLSITDGVSTYDLLGYSLRATPMTETFNESLTGKFMLQYGTSYSITLSVDPDSQTIPDLASTGPLLLVSLLPLLVGLAWLPLGRSASSESGPDLAARWHNRGQQL